MFCYVGHGVCGILDRLRIVVELVCELLERGDGRREARVLRFDVADGLLHLVGRGNRGVAQRFEQLVVVADKLARFGKRGIDVGFRRLDIACDLGRSKIDIHGCLCERERALGNFVESVAL